MIKRKRVPKVFFGWWMNLVTGIWSGLGHGFYGYGFSVFFKPLADDLGFTRAVTSVAAGIGRLEGGLESPLTGWLADKFGPRWIIVAGTCVVVIGLVLMNFINSLWSFYLVWGITIGFGLNLAHTIAVDKALANWFVRKRGLAIGTRFVLIGIGGVIALPVVTWLVTTYGWRITCLVWGGVMLAGIPLLWLFVKQNRPEYYGLLPDGAAVEEEATDTNQMIDKGVEYAAENDEIEFTLRQTMKTQPYWMIVIAWVGSHLIMGGINIHFIPFLTDMGIDPMAAGGMMAMMVFFTVPARFLAGFLADHVRKDRLQLLLAGAFLLQGVGLIAFLLKQTITMIYVFLIVFGFGSGATTPLKLTMQGRYFGRKAFGSIQGTSMMFAAPASLIAPIYAGWIYDTTGSYTTALILFAVLATISALIMCLARPPKPPAEVTDVHRFM
ncbi:MFS transporter [Chloroflexota bacterium]